MTYLGKNSKILGIILLIGLGDFVMNKNEQLAELLFGGIDKTPEYYEEKYPKRSLPEGAPVTRIGPSPTGFVHLGNLYLSLIHI